jgi:ribonuclease Z
MGINITFLGTSAQIPTAVRNHTSILLSYDNENILVDCGEGTQRQFRRAKLNPCKVTRILISHIHGDHVLGIPGFLSTLALSGYNKKLFIYGPRGTKNFINKILDVFNFRKEYDIVIKDVSGKFFECEDFYLEAEAMEHGIPCNAYCFVKKGLIRIDKEKLKKSGISSGPVLKDLKLGKNIVYKGKKYLFKNLTFKEENKKVCFVLDTLINKKIVPFVKNSDLLVCESSFRDGDKDKAKEHLHLTAKQCGEIAKKSGSKKLVLTHISQRYEKCKKELLGEVKSVFDNSFLVKDLEGFEV